jgi:hypothetical protein
MYSRDKYEKYEAEFLEAMADKFGIAGKHQIAFIYRLLMVNETKTDKKLANTFRKQLSDDPEKSDLDIARIWRDSWDKTIYPKLEKQGFQFKVNSDADKTHKRWLAVRNWLKETYFEDWLKAYQPPTLTEIWLKIWDQAIETTKILIQRPKLQTLGVEIKDEWQPKTGINYPSFPVETKIEYRVKIPQKNYLILLEKFTSGKIYCLSPSRYMPKFPTDTEEVSLPHEKLFTVTGDPGFEEIIAITSKIQPSLNWLPQPTDKPLVLETYHLDQLSKYINQNQDCEVMKTKYLIRA